MAFAFAQKPTLSADQTNSYNTPLSAQEQAAYQAWRSALPANLQNTADYDLQGAWKANAQEAGNGHLPDTWKKPSHITFSDGSIYADAQNPPGQWQQDPANGSWTYMASPGLTQYRDPSDLLNYFQVYEPGNHVVLPKGTQ